MHRELAADLFRPGRPGLFRRDLESWLTMAVILLPLYAALVWMLWTPMKPLKRNVTFIDSMPMCRLWNGVGIHQDGRILFPAQYRVRTASRWIALVLAISTASMLAARKGGYVRLRMGHVELNALPIRPDRVAFFAVLERIRSLAWPGVLCFIGLLVFSTVFSLWLHYEDAAVKWNQTLHMMLDIWGSSAYYVALRFGQCYLIAWLTYSAVILWASKLSRGLPPVLVLATTAWAAVTENPFLMLAAFSLLGFFLFLRANRLFEVERKPTPESRWLFVRFMRWMMRVLAT